MYQKLDLIELKVTHENLNCVGIMQDKPYITKFSVQVNTKILPIKLKSLEYRDARRQDRDYLVHVILYDGYVFKLTFLAHVNFTPRKPYIVATLTHDMSFE